MIINKGTEATNAKTVLTSDLKRVKHALDSTSKDIQKILNAQYSTSLSNLKQYAIKKPIKSLSIAALIGLFIGFRLGK